MRALVTGGAGFIGSHLCETLLDLGHVVWCVDNLHLGKREHIAHLAQHGDFRFFPLDVLDEAALDEVLRDGHFDTVFHLAANSDIARGAIDRRLDRKLTFETTLAVAAAMERHAVRRLFFASSSAIFGESAGPLAEDSGPVEPVSFYGAAKLSSEAFLSTYAHSFGFQVWTLRFPNVVGERSTHGVVHDFMRRLRAEPTRLEVLGDGNQEKPYLYVKDLVRAILLVVERGGSPWAVYHIAGRGRTTVRDIAGIVIEEMGLKKCIVSYTGERRGWIGDVAQFQYDTRKIEQLGFVPRLNSTESVRFAVRRMLGKE